MFFTTFPFIAEVVAVKLLLSFVSLFAMAIGCENECYIIDSFKGVVDIILSIIICCCILSFILVYLFSVTLVSSIW